MAQEEIDQFDLKIDAKKSEFNYILEVDLRYPDNLHDSHTDYPLAGNSKAEKSWHVFLVNIDSKNL